MPFSGAVPEPQQGWSEPGQSARRSGFLGAHPEPGRPLKANLAGPGARWERTERRQVQRARAGGRRGAFAPGALCSPARLRGTAAAKSSSSSSSNGGGSGGADGAGSLRRRPSRLRQIIALRPRPRLGWTRRPRWPAGGGSCWKTGSCAGSRTSCLRAWGVLNFSLALALLVWRFWWRGNLTWLWEQPSPCWAPVWERRVLSDPLAPCGQGWESFLAALLGSAEVTRHFLCTLPAVLQPKVVTNQFTPTPLILDSRAGHSSVAVGMGHPEKWENACP